jgi:hypothetical protein
MAARVSCQDSKVGADSILSLYNFIPEAGKGKEVDLNQQSIWSNDFSEIIQKHSQLENGKQGQHRKSLSSIGGGSSMRFASQEDQERGSRPDYQSDATSDNERAEKKKRVAPSALERESYMKIRDHEEGGKGENESKTLEDKLLEINNINTGEQILGDS